MAVRPEMQKLVSRLRSVTGAAVDDDFHGVTYWTDDQLQEALDAHKYEVWSAPLTPIIRKVDGGSVVLQAAFEIRRGFWVANTFTIRDGAGNEVFNSAFTVETNQEHGTVTFESDIGTTPYFIDFTVVDWNGAAAQVWDEKAAHRYHFVTLKAADYRFEAEAEYKHCVERAAWHRQRRVKSFHVPRRGFVLTNERPRR